MTTTATRLSVQGERNFWLGGAASFPGTEGGGTWSESKSQSTIQYKVTALNSAGSPVAGAPVRLKGSGVMKGKNLRQLTDSAGNTAFNLYYRYEGVGGCTIWLDKNDNGKIDSGEPFANRHQVWVNYYKNYVASGSTAIWVNNDIRYWINDWRRAHGLVALVNSANGNSGSVYHTNKMISCGKEFHAMGHNWVGTNGTGWGENVILGAIGAWAPLSSQAWAMELWKHSPDHNRNLLEPSWRYIGLGITDSTSTRAFCNIFSTVNLTNYSGNFGCTCGATYNKVCILCQCGQCGQPCP